MPRYFLHIPNKSVLCLKPVMKVLSSLRLHPQGWVALSRNTSSDESTEWCTVHDIQSLPTDLEEDELISSRAPLMWRSSTQPAPAQPANSLAALEMIGEFQQRRLRGAASGYNSAAAAEEALEAGEEAAAAAVEHRVEAAADARVGNGEARREGINIIGAGNVPFGAEEGFRSDRGGFLIIGPNTGPRGRGRVLYFGTPGAHRAQQQRIPEDAKIHRNVKR